MERTVALIAALFVASFLFAQGGEQKLKENAQRFFDDEKYVEALPLYSQLVSLYPTNSVYNFKYGTCIIFGGQDKEKAISFLKFATEDPSISNAAWFYYGKALHLNYRFNDALNAYRKFEGKASKRELLDHPVKDEIIAARNGLELLSELKDITVLDKLEVTEAEFFRYFDLSDIGGRILVTPEELKTSLDRKKKFSSLVHYPENTDAIYYSSYGKDGRTGKDIYRTFLLPDGNFTEPQKLAGYVNTDLDEDFAFMHPDGRSFYFCSKGHNSMGGYDVFKSTYDNSNDVFGPAQNLDFAINTPDDDIFYIVDSIYDLAYFASSRSSQHGKIHVYKIKNERTPVNLSIIKGEFLSEIAPDNRKAKITVEDALSRERIGVYNTDAGDGSYVIALPRGGKYRMIVEADQSNKTHVGVVDIPRRGEVHAFKQEISLVMRSNQEKLVIRNLFDEAVDDDLIALALAEIKRRAALDVNFLPDVSADGQTEDKTVEDASLDAGFSGDLSNEDIVNMAYEDASALEREAEAVNERADLAFMLANDKVIEAKQLVGEADRKVKMADATEDPIEKERLMTEAEHARVSSERTNQEALVAFELAANLESVLSEKAEDAAVAMVYARELEEAINSDSYEEAVEKLSEQKEKIEKTSGPNARKLDVYEAAREKAMNKQDEADKALVRANSIRDDEIDLRNRITRARTQMEGTNSKSKKAEFQAEIDGYEADLVLVEKDIERAFDRASELQEKADLLDAQAQLYFAMSNGSEGSEPTEAIVLSNEQKQQIRKDIAENDEQLSAIEIDPLLVVDAGPAEIPSEGPGITTEVMSAASTNDDRQATTSQNEIANKQDGTTITGTEIANTALAAGTAVTLSIEEDNSRLEKELQATESIENLAERTAEQKKVNEDWVAILDADIAALTEQAEEEDDPEVQQELLRQANELSDMRQRKQLQIDESEGVLAALAVNPTTGERAEIIQDADLIEALLPEYQTEWDNVARSELSEEEKLRAWAELDEEVVEKAQDEIAADLATIDGLDSDDPILQEIAQLRAIDKRMRAEAAQLNHRADLIATDLLAADREPTAIELAEESQLNSTAPKSERAEVARNKYVIRSEHEDIYASEIEFRSKEAAEAFTNSANDKTKVAELGVEIEALEASMDEMTDTDLRAKTERRVYKLRDDQLILNSNIGQRSEYQNKEEYKYNEDSLETLLARIDSEVNVGEFDPIMAFINTEKDRAKTKFSEAKELRKRAERESDMEAKDLMYREAYSLESWGLQDLDRSLTASNYMLSEEHVPGKDLSYEEMEESLFGVTLVATTSQVQNAGTEQQINKEDLAQVNTEETSVEEEFAIDEENGHEDPTALSEQDAGTGKEMENDQATPVEEKNTLADEAISGQSGNGTLDEIGTDGSNTGVNTETGSENEERSLVETASNEEDESDPTEQPSLAHTTEESDTELENATNNTEDQADVEIRNEEQVPAQTFGIETDQETGIDISVEEADVLTRTERDIRADHLNTTTPEARIERSGNVVRIGSGLVIAGDPKSDDEQFSYQALPMDDTPPASVKEFELSDDLEDESLMLIEQAQMLRDSSYTVKKKEREPLIQQAVAMEEKARELQNDSKTAYIRATEMEAVEAVERRTEEFETGLHRSYDLNAEELQTVVEDEAHHYYFEIQVKAKKAEQAAIKDYLAEEQVRSEAQSKIEQSRDLLFVADSIENEDVRVEFIENANELNKEAVALNARADSLKKEARRNESIVIHNNRKAREHLADLDEATASKIENLERNAARKPALSLAISEGEEPIASDRVVVDRIETADATSVVITRREENIEPTSTEVVPEVPTFEAGPNTTDGPAAFVDPVGYQIPKTLVADIFTTKATNTYNEEAPIPVDPPMPTGLVYKVQVGAFRNAIPQDLYEGFAPVMGEKLDNGITRYTAGLFTSYSTAGLAKEIIRDVGYSDAFVVAFFNGERVSLSEARAMQSEEQLAATPVTTGERPEFNMLDTQGSTMEIDDENGNIGIGVSQEDPELLSEYPSTSEELLNNFQPEAEAGAYYDDPNAAEAEQVETIQGLFYTVQVGVYSNPVLASAIYNIQPLNSQRTESGLIRYTTGQFTDLGSARDKKNEIVLVGVSDAFITAYLNGKRIPMKEAAALVQKFGPSIFTTE